MNHFSTISLWGWRQFRRVEIDLSAQLVVLTGPNGCGKTTILNVLGKHFGWNIQFVSTPHLSSRKERRFWSDVFENRASEFSDESTQSNVGQITYSNGQTCDLRVPTQSDSHQYQLSYSNQLGIPGIHIPSHRPVTNYVQIESIPVNPKSSQQQFQDFQQLLLQTYGSTNVRNPGTILKQSLIALAVFGFGNEAVAPNHQYRAMFREFEQILHRLLPRSLGFERLEVRAPDIVFHTKTGTFALDAMSGGVSAIVGMAWQIHMYGADQQFSTIIIDEPENHLHPSMQREFLPALIEAFPDYRFIVSTHSPFVVGSSPDASVYSLVFDEDRRIVSKRLANDELSGSPNRILREILDVPTTLPIWVERELAQLLSELQYNDDREASIAKIHESLVKFGIDLPLADLMREVNR